jgi:hypothetical protein
MEPTLTRDENAVTKHAWDMYEQRLGAPNETGYILNRGHFAVHFMASDFEDGPHKVRLIPNQDRSSINRNNLGLHEALVHTANEMIKASSRTVEAAERAGIDTDDIANIKDGEQQMTLLIAAYKNQVDAGAGTGKRKGGPGGPKGPSKKKKKGPAKKKTAGPDAQGSDDPVEGDVDSRPVDQPDEPDVTSPDIMEYMAQIKLANAWAKTRVQNIVMGEIEANCVVPEEQGNEVGGERFLRSEVWMSNLIYTDQNTRPPGPDILSWEQVLRQIIVNNRARASGDAGPPSRFAPQVVESEYGRIHKVMSGYQFIQEFVLPMLPHDDIELTSHILSDEFTSKFYGANGQLNPMIGPWTESIARDYRGVCIDDVFALSSILRWKNTDDNSMPPMYREQLTDDWLYFRPFLDYVGASRDDSDAVIEYQDQCKEDRAYTYGISFEDLYARCPKLRRAVFVLDAKNTTGATWRSERPSFAWWWSGPLPESQSTEVCGSGVFNPSSSGIGNAVMRGDARSSVPLRKDKLPAVVPADDDDPFLFDMTKNAPIAQFADRARRSMKLFARSTRALRDGEIQYSDYVCLHKLQLQTARVLMDLVPNMSKAAKSTRALMLKIKEEGFYYRRRGEAKFKFDVLAVDFEGGCNFTQHLSILLELGGMSTLHGMYQLLHVALLSGAWVHEGLHVNPFFYGPPGAGKSMLGEQLQAHAVKGTITEQALDTERAALNQNEPCRYNGSTWYNEIPTGFVVDRREKDGAGSVAENMHKLQMTEHRIQARTNTCDGGIRTTVTLQRSDYNNMMVMCNLRDIEHVSAPIVSRMLPVKVPYADREGHSIADYSVWGQAHCMQSSGDELHERTCYIVQMSQLLTAQLGTLVYAGVLPAPNHLAFALIYTNVMTAYTKKNGQVVDGRTMQKANDIALSLMFRRIAYDNHLQPFAPFSGTFGLRDQFNSHQRLAASLVITETEAIQALVCAVATFNETDVRRFATSVLYLMATESKQKDSYSRYFLPRSSGAAAKKKRKRWNDDDGDEDGLGDEAPEFDLSTARFDVGNTSDSLTNWCGSLCKIMQQIYHCTVNKFQVRETLNRIADAEGPWKHTRHMPQDMNIPNPDGAPCTAEYLGEWTVRSYREDTIRRRLVPGPLRSDVDRAGEEWRRDMAFAADDPKSQYFPYEIHGGGLSEVVTTNCDLGDYMSTGYISISTAFLVKMARMKLGNIEDIVDSACSTNTTPRAIIPVVMTDTMTYGTTLPYVHPTVRLHTHPSRESVVTNPKHADPGLWSKIMGSASVQPVGRHHSEVTIPSFVPVDAWSTFLHVRELAERDPEMVPDVYTLLPWSCIRTIIVPGILELLERTDPLFAELYPRRGEDRDRKLQERVRCYLEDNLDLVRHCITDDHGQHAPLDESMRANEMALMQIKCLAHHVCELSKSKGVGRMREAAMNMPDKADVRANIKQLMHALKHRGAARDALDPRGGGEDLSVLTDGALKSRLDRQTAKLRIIRDMQKGCREHSASNHSFASYLDEYRHLLQTGKIVYYHRYESFVQWIRAKARFLQDEHVERESSWTGTI